jgi:iron(III) transport system ATP-binding protein
MPEIQVENLTKTFGEQRALDSVAFSVEDGELFTLLGPSGCGKSTTLMSIAGFQQPDEGRISVGSDTFFDADRRLSVAAERRNLGIVFQSYAVWPHMTVFENLAFPLKVRKLKRREVQTRVHETLDLVEMRQYEKRYPHQLSGGQQQRVALGRALVYSPSVLLLDEPFSNLDSLTRFELQDTLLRVWEQHRRIVVMVTHDIDEALYLCDRLVLMTDGPEARVGETIRVPFPRPRVRPAVLAHPDYYSYRRRIIDFLENHARQSRIAVA